MAEASASCFSSSGMVPKRGERCVPSFVKLTAQKVAELKGIPFEDVAAATTANALRLFRKMRI